MTIVNTALAAAVGRRVQPVDLRHRRPRKRARPRAGARSGLAQARQSALRDGGGPRGLPRRPAGRLRCRPAPPPGAGRDDLQPRLPAPQGRDGGPAGGHAGGDRARPCRARLSRHGDAALAVRRQPGGDQRDCRRAVPRGHRPGDRIRPRPPRRDRRRGDGPRHPRAHPRPQARRRAPPPRRAQPRRFARTLRRAGRFGRGHDAALAVRRRRRRGAAALRPAPTLSERPPPGGRAGRPACAAR